MWKWKYFTRKELSSKDDGSFLINEDALNKLERMRNIIGKPLIINSAYRSLAHNKAVKGSANSMHVQGRAFDVSIKGHNPVALYQAALDAGFAGFGFARTYLHVDTGNKRYWEYKKGDKRKFVVENTTLPEIALSIDKETENPRKVESVGVSDTTIAAGTGVVVATGGLTAIDPTFMIEHAPSFLSFLKTADWRIAMVVLVIVVIAGFVWWRARK